MKKLIAIVVAAVMVLAALPVLPALADSTVNTGVTVLSGTGVPPLVKAMWQSSTTDENVPVAPNVGFQATTPVVFWAVVTDPAGVANISHVYADVYYPATGADPGPNGSLKFEVELTGYFSDEPGMSVFDDAYNAGMVTINTSANVTKADIDNELNEGLARVYVGQFNFDNCELAGNYPVTTNAVNQQNVHGTLSNTFDWVAVTAVDFDFNAVQYGSVAIGVDKSIGGDLTWDTPTASAPSPNPATIRNTGNTYLQMTVKQDDMGFGQTQVNGNTVWNVSYDARLGDGENSGPAPGQYGAGQDNEGIIAYPPAVASGGNLAGSTAVAVVPQILRLCAQEKVDFSITVTKDPSSTSNHTYSGSMILGALYNAGPPTNGFEYVPPATPPTMAH